MRIIITRNFDKLDPIGYLQLRDGVEIPPDSEFALGYTVVEGTLENPTKIHVHEVSLIPSQYSAKFGKTKQVMNTATEEHDEA